MCAAIPALGLTSKLAGGLFLGSLAIGVASTVQAQRVANQQASYAYESARRSALSADAAFAAQQEALADNLKETRASSAQENLAKTIEGLQARGRTIASEQAGITVGYLLRDVERQSANARESINQALESATRQYSRNVQGLVAQRDNRRNQLQSNINQAYNQIPTLGSIILNTAAQGLSSFTAIKYA